MDIAWFAPPVILLAGAGLAAVLARRVAEAVDEVQASARRVRRLDDALIPVRVESRRARASIDRIRHR